ncbi:Outer membrane efflux protein [Crateriforma conspicua]|nr:Outer membrane efflux protein [Crateriforma conspicua]
MLPLEHGADEDNGSLSTFWFKEEPAVLLPRARIFDRYRCLHSRWIVACLVIMGGCRGHRPAWQIAQSSVPVKPSAASVQPVPSPTDASIRGADTIAGAAAGKHGSPWRLASHESASDVTADDAAFKQQWDPLTGGDQRFATIGGPELWTGGGGADGLPPRRPISEAEMLTIALTDAPAIRSLGIRVLSNPESLTTAYDRAIEVTDPFFGPAAALAEFDSQLSASLNTANNDRVFNNATLGGEVQELVQDTAEATIGWQKRSVSGAVFDIQRVHLYDNNNRQGNRFPNYWESYFEAGVRQPLLRGAGRTFNEIAGPNASPGFNFSNGILIARMNTQISDIDFRIALRDFVQELYATYWTLRREYQSLESLLEAKQMAYETWQSTLARREADLQGGEADKEAQARSRYYQLRRQIINVLDADQPQSGLLVTERRLRQMLGMPINEGTILFPVDPPADVKYVFDFPALVQRGLSYRDELRRQSIRVQQERYRLIAAKNFLLPQVDLIGRYRVRGFGDDLFGDGLDRFSSAFDDFYSFDHQEWQFGLEMGVPVGRRQAKAAVANAKLQLNRQLTILDQQQTALRTEISDAYSEVDAAYDALTVSKEILDASQDRYDASLALYENDKIQIEFLLDAQQELVRSQQQMAEDQSRYSLSLIQLNAVTGTLLTDLGINVAYGPCGTQESLVEDHP